jgi:hypothetical protein
MEGSPEKGKTVQISLVLHRMEPHRQMFRACTGHIFGPSTQTIKMRHILGRTLANSRHETAQPKERL